MKVTKHQAKDGSLHDTARLCEIHNRKMRLAPAMEKFVNGLPADTAAFTESEGVPVIRLIDLPDFLTAHAEQLQVVVANALIIRKPRKAKTSAANDAQAAAA